MPLRRILAFGGSALLLAQSAYAGVTLSCDFSNPGNQRADVYNFWNAHNQTQPYTSIKTPAVTDGAGINCVRMLGGWPDYTVVAGTNTLNTSTLANDSYQWNGSSYVYNWGPLTNRINVVLNSGMALYQMVLDDPPWAFQRGLQFVAVRDNVHYLAEDQYAKYGNAVPPNDPAAWANFIKAMLTQLTNTYGAALVSQWRFRVGSEIDTCPGHWVGTEQDYLNHYSNTVRAVRAILPTAKVGAQFFSATKSPKYVNYTGTTNGGFGVGFVRFCYTNNLPYDFIGVSAYNRYDSSSAVNMDTFYANAISPIRDHPQFNTNATMEIHEYNCCTGDGIVVRVTTSHDAAYFAMLGKMFYEKNLTKLQQWANVIGGSVFIPRVLTQAALSTMVGKKRYGNATSGSPAVSGNIINGLFACDQLSNRYDALIFNYNVSPTYRAAETVNLALTVPLPAGTACEYRYATYSSNECAFQKFVADYPLAGLWESQGGWVLNGKDKNSNLNDILNSAGRSAWRANQKNYAQYNNLQWSAWVPIASTVGSNGTNSTLSLTTTLPSFAYKKFEIRPATLPPLWLSADIGSPMTGDVSLAGGIFTVQGSGADIWSTNDQFHYVYQPASGDCEIIARVASLENVTNPWAKAGVMIRETLADDSANAAVFVTSSNGVTFQNRTVTGGTSVRTTKVDNLTAPYWVKITRVGNTFTGYLSVDGTTWTLTGSPVTIVMGTNVYLGLAVTSRDNSSVVEARFDNVKTSIPVANAGSDQALVDFEANGSEVVTLDASGSLPGTGSITSHSWKEGATQIASGINPSVVLGLGTHTLTLTVTSTSGATSSDSVEISVSPLPTTLSNTLFDDLADSAPRKLDGQPPSILGITASDLSVYAGRGGTGYSVDRCMVFPFELPDLGNVNNPFISAAFSFNLEANDFTPTNCNLDLYGLINRSSATVLATDYYSETDVADPTLGTARLENNLCTPASAPGLYTNSPAGSAALVNYLNAQYAAGANRGKFVFLRLNKDAAVGNSNKRYTVTTADGAVAANDGEGNDNIWPQINYQSLGLALLPDTDFDGLPDPWEMQNFNSLSNTASDDWDGDGQSNGAEYIAGTNPKDANSRFYAKSITAGGGGFTVKWDSVAARTYSVLQSGSVNGSWTAISGAMPGTGGELLFTAATVSTNRFYKIQVTLP